MFGLRRKVLFAAVVAAFGASAMPGHPRMFFTAKTWPDVKACAEGPARSHLDRLLRLCDSYPTNPVCSGTGSVKYREIKTASGSMMTTDASPINTVRDWGTEAARCALAWRFTGQRKYLDKAKRMLEVSVAAYHEAYLNGRAVHWYNFPRVMALCAYDWLWEGLSPDERRSIIVPLVEHVEEVQPRKGGKHIIRRNGGGPTTGFYGVRGMLWYSGLAASGDGFCDDLAKKHLEEGRALCMEMLKVRSDTAGDDGGLVTATPEYAMNAYPWAHFNFFHTYLSAFGENLASRYPALALFPNWVYWTWIPTADPERPCYSGFGDSQHLQNNLSIVSMYAHLAQYIKFYRTVDQSAARLAATLRARIPETRHGYTENIWPIYPFILHDAAAGVEPSPDDIVENLPLHARHFERLGQFLLRSGWKTNSTYCTFTAGAMVRQHKHHDENNFTIYKDDFLAIDSGSRGVETDWNLRYYYSQTVAHNCVLILRPGEPLPNHFGPKYQGPEGETNYGGMYDAPAKVLAFETGEFYTYIASDATKCYNAPKPYAPKCSAAVRQFVHLLPDVFVVYDRVGATDPGDRKVWLLHTVDEPLVKDGLTRADCRGGRLFCQTLLPANAKIEKVGGPGREFLSNGKNWELDSRFLQSADSGAKRLGRGPYFGAWRLEVSPAGKNADDSFLHVLTATDAGDGVPPAARLIRKGNRDGVAATVRNVVRGGVRGVLDAEILFNRAGDVGGEISIAFTPNGSSSPADAVKRPLATAVTPQKGCLPLE